MPGRKPSEMSSEARNNRQWNKQCLDEGDLLPDTFHATRKLAENPHSVALLTF